MSESIDQAKTRLRKKYVGRLGIHAFGLDLSANSIIVYFEPLNKSSQLRLLEAVRREAGEYKVQIKPDRAAQPA